MKLRSLFALALLCVGAPAYAQVTPGLLGNGQVLGNFSGAQAQPGPTNLMTFPVVSGHLPSFNGTTGAMQDNGMALIGLGTLNTPGGFNNLTGLVVQGTPGFNSNNSIELAKGTIANGAGGSITFYAQPGPIGVPTAIATGNELAFIQSYGWDGASFGFLTGNPTGIGFVATENWNTTSHGQGILFQATPNGTLPGLNEASINNGFVALAAAEGTKPGNGLGTVTGENGVYTGQIGVGAGKLVFFNATSGSVALNAPSGPLGTQNIAMPAASGTIAVSGTAPISLNNGSGAISCPTCGVTGSPLSQFASTTSAQLRGTVSDPTGTGSAVFGTSPNITTPTGIVRGDVGLGNVANVDTTNAANITSGTLPAARLGGMSFISNALGADVLLNNTGNYFDGPSIAQGTSGTWFAVGKVTIADTAGVAAIVCKLWDGTTIIDSSNVTVSGANLNLAMTMTGTLASPAANIKISCKDATSVSGKILFNGSANSKDSSLTAIRIN